MQILPAPEQVLHFNESKSWFNSRHSKQVKEQYRKTQKELFEDQVLTETFHLIDRDHSNTIEFDELYTMLKKNNYPVNMGLLKAFFEKTDKDGNKCIDLDEFKQVIKDESATQSFRMMMRKMRETGEENYYSTDFVNLLRYLSYCSNRTDLIWQIKNTRLSIDVRSKLVSELLQVNQRFTKIAEPKEEQKVTLWPFQRKNTQSEIKYLTPMCKRPNFHSKMSTKTQISTSHQNSMISLQPPSLASPRLSPLKTDRIIQLTYKKKKSFVSTLLTTKSTLQSTKSTSKRIRF